MKKVIIILLSCFSITAAAQQWLGVQVAFDQPRLLLNDGTSKKLTNRTIFNGFKIGLVYDATLIKGFGFSLALNYGFSEHHTNWEDDPSVMGIAQEIKYQSLLHTLEIPIDWQYKFEIAKEFWLILYTGPALQYNFVLKEKISVRNNANLENKNAIQVTEQSHYEIDIDNDGRKDYTPINLLWSVGGGIQYKRYFLRAGYDFGIYNPFRDVDLGKEFNMRGRFDQWQISRT